MHSLNLFSDSALRNTANVLLTSPSWYSGLFSCPMRTPVNLFSNIAMKQQIFVTKLKEAMQSPRQGKEDDSKLQSQLGKPIWCDTTNKIKVIQRRHVLKSPLLLVSSERPYIHRLCLHHLVLVLVENTEIIDRVQRRRVLKSPRLLLSSQRPHIHLLCVHYLALISVEIAEIVYRVQRRCVLKSPSVLLSS
jgi:hypothetical protein